MQGKQGEGDSTKAIPQTPDTGAKTVGPDQTPKEQTGPSKQQPPVKAP